PPGWLDDATQMAAAAARNREEAGHERVGNWCAWLAAHARLGSDPLDLPCWQALAELLLVGSEDRLRETITVRQGFPARSELKLRWQAWRDELASRSELVRSLCEVRALPPPRLEAAEHAAITSLARVLLVAAAELKLVFRERGLVDHGEVAAVARQALRSLDEEAGYSLRQTLRVSHLLVDECQDTSPDQIELLRALTAGWQRGDAR